MKRNARLDRFYSRYPDAEEVRELKRGDDLRTALAAALWWWKRGGHRIATAEHVMVERAIPPIMWDLYDRGRSVDTWLDYTVAGSDAPSFRQVLHSYGTDEEVA